jgi:putative acetyltransferase
VSTIAGATLALEAPDAAGVAALIAALDAYQDTLYPPECRYALDLTSVADEQMRFIVARDAQGRALACGAVVLCAAYGEIKRMWVQPEARGQGLAGQLLARLEAEARATGCPALTLETGPKQPDAIRLYARHGFAACGPFGDYRDDAMSVFMHKPLA